MVEEMPASSVVWTHPSARLIAGDSGDAAAVIAERARALALGAMSNGWEGPPFDPVGLAETLNIPLRPREDIADARLIPVGERRFLLEYNPARPPARVRYSIAHEIAHTLFPDCGEQIRNRSRRGEQSGDEWQLEALCNIAAAELLMPVGSLSSLDVHPLTIDHVLELRKKFDVSTEAVLRRIADVTSHRCLIFASSKREAAPGAGRFQIDYSFPSRTWRIRPRGGVLLPKGNVVERCTAIGYTAKGEGNWPGVQEAVRVECIGVQPYPDRLHPRVLGLVVPTRSDRSRSVSIEYVTGDATQPHGHGNRIIAHVVNDKTPTWGAGFAAAVRRKWPIVQEEFQQWARESHDRLVLGNIHLSRLDASLQICHMIAQRGYGESRLPRIRYDALEKCLKQLAEVALQFDSTVHMPRIGTGHAGGMWSVISELIIENLCNSGVQVTVYDLRGSASKKSEQLSLFQKNLA